MVLSSWVAPLLEESFETHLAVLLRICLTFIILGVRAPHRRGILGKNITDSLTYAFMFGTYETQGPIRFNGQISNMCVPTKITADASPRYLA